MVIMVFATIVMLFATVVIDPSIGKPFAEVSVLFEILIVLFVMESVLSTTINVLFVTGAILHW